MTARTEVVYESLIENDGLDLAGGTTIDATNKHCITIPRVTTPGAADSADRLFVLILTTTTTDKTMTVKAGPSTDPSFRGGTGDLVVHVTAQAGGALIGPLEATRFMQADGTIHLDPQAGMTGVIFAYMWPERW